MDNLKHIKWSLLLLQNYEYKEYKERHNIETNKELATINILSNIINNNNLFSSSDVEDAKNFINSFHISDAEKKAFKKIMTNPYSKQFFLSEISNIAIDTCYEIFLTISDIFITKSKSSKSENDFIKELGYYLKIDETHQLELIENLRKAFFNLKLLLKNKKVTSKRNKICSDLIKSEFNNFNNKEFYENGFFETKDYIISSVILIASIFNFNLNVPKILSIIWTPIILYKKDLKKASILASELSAIYMRYEKIVDWNVVNLNNLIKQSKKDKKAHPEFEEVKDCSINFTSKIIKHAFSNDEHKKISKFQRSLKN